MPSSIHSFLPRLALIAAPLVVGATVYAVISLTRPYDVPAETDIFQVVTGKWAWTGPANPCDSDPHTIAFSSDRTEMLITHAQAFRGADGQFDSVTHYKILAHTRGWIRGAIPGETRLTDQGNPVIWDLVLRSPNTYAWHRTDWGWGESTRNIQRCVEP